MIALYLISGVIFLAIICVGTMAILDIVNHIKIVPFWIFLMIIAGTLWGLSLFSMNLREVAVKTGNFKKIVNIKENIVNGNVVSRTTNIGITYFTNVGKR